MRLCAAGFVAYWAATRSAALPPSSLARELGAGPSLIGFVMGASTLTGVFLKPCRRASDLFGRRRLLVAVHWYSRRCPSATWPSRRSRGWWFSGSFMAARRRSSARSRPLACLTLLRRRGWCVAEYMLTAQGAGQAIGPILAGYAIAAGRFDLAFAVSGLIGLGAPLIVGTWRGAAAGTSTRPSWQAFKQGVSEVVGDRLVLITSAAHAAQFVLNGMLNAFLPCTGARS